jgi:lysophospholipase L1-like esterase
MKSRMTVLSLATLCIALLCLPSMGQVAGEKENTAIKPSPRKGKGGMPDANWMKRHDSFVEIAKKGDIDLLLMGDSITDGWRGKGKAVYEKYFPQLKTANFGIGGDKTEHVLWRLQNGEMEGYTPKAVMLMIGTNNIGNAPINTPEETAAGVEAIVKTMRGKWASAKILLLAVFPRDEKPDGTKRQATVAINKSISKLGDGKNVVYLDINDKFLTKDGMLTTEMMKDRLHPEVAGYQIWAEAVLPTLKDMVGAKK